MIDQLIIVDSSDIPLHKNNLFLENVKLKNTEYVYKHTRPGLTYQRNVGVALATGGIIFFLDDDAILEQNYIELMMQTFARSPNYIGGMGTIVVEGKKEHILLRIIRRVFLLQRMYADGNMTFSGMPTHCYGTNHFKQVHVLNGCGAYKKELFTNQLFDEQLTTYAYMEDMDFSYRAGRSGDLFFNPLARIHHIPSPEARDDIQTNRAMYIYNYSYLFFKLFYPHNKLRIIAYWWTIVGLFVYAIVLKKWQFCKGYWCGLKQFYF